MAIFDINKLADYREHNQLEAKSAKGGFPGSFWETYSSFANTDGGIILLGVKEGTDGALLPENIDAEKLRKDFWNMVNNRQKISANIVTERMVQIEDFNGHKILVIRVPRAERNARPVYEGQDPKTGSYRRNHDGDYHCSLEEVALMFRDASNSWQDAKVFENMDASVFCPDTIRGYRNFFRTSRSNHLWNDEDDEVFLRKIGAISIGEDGLYHPTAAGLLMFGYEYEITREFPNYFLDYQEDRSLGMTRWSDRLVSTSGEWSGNVFDFVIEVLRRMQHGLKVPFVLRGNQRIDDTPIHNMIREAVTNAAVHADFYGRQRLVIQKSKDGYILSNPGNLRISIDEAVKGGISDPRNGVMLKMFSLVDFGERAGSGLSGICHMWEKIYHTPVIIEEKHTNGVDRTVLTLSTGNNEPDLQSMLAFYQNEGGVWTTQNEENTIRSEQDTTLTTTLTAQSEHNTTRTAETSTRRPYKLTPTQTQILSELRKNPRLSRKNLSDIIQNVTEGGIKYNLKRLQELGFLRRIGADYGGHWEVLISQ
ncbi:RNA-binding domain-containing protein [Duncaniella dubosii]|uniref:RNA-binding domain-containing protein n=1 Tax=Duncaniella dubosii TaxID=2518971 RepID=UPI0023EFC367|nr:RNA-binding domain-containing protein [Duncaniella dubosii]MCX4284848.1 putative DNA binding domain-containing protein [Duncaniella dubosii]